MDSDSSAFSATKPKDSQAGNSEGQRAVASESDKSNKMIDKGDLDSGMAKDIRAPSYAEPTSPPPNVLPQPPSPPGPPPTNPIIGDLIKNKFEKTKVIVKPVAY